MKNIETKRFLLRGPKIDDAKEIYEKWGKDKDCIAEYKEHSPYKNIIETQAYLKTVIIESQNGVPFWFIESKDTHEIEGYIKLVNYSLRHKRTEVEFYFIEKCRHRGKPKEMLKGVTECLFKKTLLDTVVIEFYDIDDIRTNRLCRTCKELGFTQDGILRNKFINSKGKKIDRYVYSITREEWEEIERHEN